MYRRSTKVPVAGASSNTHHEHNPGDGFCVLFVWALPTSTRVPRMRNKRSQPVPCNPPSVHHEHHLGDVFRVRPGHASSASSSARCLFSSCSKVLSMYRTGDHKRASSGTHHEHHPGDGFSVLFVWALPTATRVPLMSNKRSQSPCPATQPARIMSIIRVMVSPSYLSGPFQLRQESHLCATRDHKGRALQPTQRAS